MNVVSIGEVLWDVVGQQEHIGGAPFNFAAHVARLGHEVSFVSAVGNDERGQRILGSMSRMGLSTRFIRQVPEYATGIVTISLDKDGQPDYVIHRPAAYDVPELSEEDLTEIFSHPVDWIYFGTLVQTSPAVRRLTQRLLESGKGSRQFYDVNLRNGCWQPSLVLELMARATMVKMNVDEAGVVTQLFGQPLESSSRSLENFCRGAANRFGWEGLCITRGPDGCALLLGTEYVESSGYAVQALDTVGAGDAFAAAFLHGVGSGWPANRIADLANRVAALVASRPGGVPEWTIAEVEALQGSDSRPDPYSQHRETA